MSRLTRDGTVKTVSRDQILRHARGQGNVHFLCSADHEQDWQPYPVDPYSAICDNYKYINHCVACSADIFQNVSYRLQGGLSDVISPQNPRRAQPEHRKLIRVKTICPWVRTWGARLLLS